MSYVENLGSRFEKYYGKYRGKVLENDDPLFLGRILADVAAVSGMTMNWCMPCTPYAGSDVGFYAIPPIGANVWIEFEGGDTNYPIWSGCFWAEGEVPTGGEPVNPMVKVFKTAFATFIMDDTPEVGGITLECHPASVTVPLSMKFDSTGITILAPPATIKMITEEGITLSFPPDVIAMTEETIEITVPPSTFTINSGVIELEAPAVNTTAEGVIGIEAGGEVSIEATGMVSVASLAEVSVASAINVMVNSPTVVIDGAVDINGALEVTGVILEDGMPVMVVPV
jgi:Type VI secretion system/phage-baseplate injector OB domain